MLLALGLSCDNNPTGGAPWYDPPPGDAASAKKDVNSTAPDLRPPPDAPGRIPAAPVTVNQDGPVTVTPDLPQLKPDTRKVHDQTSGTPVDGPVKMDSQARPPDLPPWAGWDFKPIPRDMVVPDLPPPDLAPPDLVKADSKLDGQTDSTPKPDAKPKPDSERKPDSKTDSEPKQDGDPLKDIRGNTVDVRPRPEKHYANRKGHARVAYRVDPR